MSRIVFILLLALVPMAFPLRIVSAAPSITETVFLLGGQSSLVGVTTYCDYPPEAKTFPQIGGYYDINLEAVMLAKPDIVLLTEGNLILQKMLLAHHIAFRKYDNESIQGVYDMVRDIGELLGKRGAADSFIKTSQKQWNAVTPERRSKQKIMVILDQVVRQGHVEAAYVLGKDKFYGPMLDKLGLMNAYQGKQPYPLINREAIQFLNPDIIVVFEKGNVKEYAQIPIKAIQNKKVFFFEDEVMKRPGPRFLQILKTLSSVSRPE